MIIKKAEQYNEAFGGYKVLSSNAGVGSIIASKTETFFMPKCCSDWGCIKQANKALNSSVPVAAEEIQDDRFVNFLRATQGLSKLSKLVTIPRIELNSYNQISKKACDEHPLSKKNMERGMGNLDKDFFSIPSIIFPRWFYSSKKHYLKPLSEWLKIWKTKKIEWKINNKAEKAICNNGKEEYFAPPRDPYDRYSSVFVDDDKRTRDMDDPYLHKQLHQMPMVLICENGHISDIPWDKFFSASLVPENVKKLRSEAGFDLFSYSENTCEKGEGGKHNIQFIENRSHTESWGMLKCIECGKMVSLEGVMNIKVFCRGEKPWISNSSFEQCLKENDQPVVMRHALATSNSVYYAETITSLFIPDELREEKKLSSNAERVYNALVNKWYPKECKNSPNTTKEEYIHKIDLKDKADDSEIEINDDDAQSIVAKFLEKPKDIKDERENYRFEEYNAFIKQAESKHEKLRYKNIKIPFSIAPYFASIKQVFNLAETSTQLSFSRVEMPQPKIDDKTREITYKHGQMIFSEKKEDVLILPANQSYGEGIFFEINNDFFDKWHERFEDDLEKRYDLSPNDIERNFFKKIQMYGKEKFYLLHTLSHVLIKEFEFSCGYPSASIKERLFYSNRMNGFMIYTADGAAGSMGGLVSQGDPIVLENIIKRALQRAYNCSSDPLCWENKEGLTLASCFSCSMISETSCEERNFGLDRQILVNEKFGFFKDLIF